MNEKLERKKKALKISLHYGADIYNLDLGFDEETGEGLVYGDISFEGVWTLYRMAMIIAKKCGKTAYIESIGNNDAELRIVYY